MTDLTKDDLSISFFDEIEYYHVLGKFDGQKKAEQVRDQILKNQEDVEQLERVNSLFAELEIPPPYDLWLAESLQIRERLKKEIEFIEGLSYKEDGNTKRVLDLLQEILGEEK